MIPGPGAVSGVKGVLGNVCWAQNELLVSLCCQAAPSAPPPPRLLRCPPAGSGRGPRPGQGEIPAHLGVSGGQHSPPWAFSPPDRH